ncbi:unnamed protein product [Pleuronectes platessa]|uniref:Uncharacterized protein n=1 Tax=Pleuronectes platessa TaxID=8262 RepID=A0A9N7U5Q9_PLEPL|nr:unnamed protein product [Pleuronectes platessa]
MSAHFSFSRCVDTAPCQRRFEASSVTVRAKASLGCGASVFISSVRSCHPPGSEQSTGDRSSSPPAGARGTEAPARLSCLRIYDQSQLDRADGWAPGAGDRLRRGEGGVVLEDEASLQVALCRHTERRACRDVTGRVCARRVSAELSADASDVR